MVARFIASSCSLTRPFHLALVLITLFLTLPQIAWGQDDGTTYTFTGTSITGNTGTATSTSGGTAYNWNIKEFQLLDGQNEATGLNPTYSNSSLGISNFGNNDKAIEADFLLESNFGFTGSFVKAEITFSASNLTNATFNIKKVIDNNNTADLAEYYINGVSDPEYTITISRPSQNNNNRLLDDNKIVFHFNFKANTGHPEASFSITSIKIYTTEYFGLTVGGVRVSSGNYKDITGGNIAFGSGGNASFDPNERILTLNNTTIHGSIYSYGNMTIDLQGTNTINADTCAIKNTNITSGNPSGTLNIKTTDGTGSLKLNHGTGPEESPTITQYFTVSYTGTGLRLIGSYDQNSQDALFAVQILGGYDNDDNSYLIKTPEQLKTFSEYVNSGMITDGTIKLYNDVDCSTLTGFVPIGNSTHKFSSYFKGNDKTISNLTISSTGDAGLFGVIYNGTVDYLNLINCTIAGGDYAGAVVGKLESGSVKFVKVKGTTSVTAVNPGAIVGDLPAISNVLETRYEYSVTTTVTNGETSSGYTPRAVGRIQGGAGGDVRDVARATLYTKTLSTSSGSNGEVRTWYISTNTYTNNGETSGSFAPGQTAYFKVAPNSGYRVSSVSVTYTEGSTTINPVLDEGNSTNEYSIYYFTMPDAAVTASATFTNGYGITIAGTEVTSENATTGITAGDGKVYYNATNNILTLNGATINGVIESTIGDLTIHLTGNSIIKATGNETSLISSTNNGTLTFETDADVATDNELYFQKSDGNYFDAIPFNGFASVAYESGLGYYSQFSQIVETLFIEYNNNRYKLHSSNANDIVGGGIVSFSYDSTNGSVLTLNNANIEVIEWKTDEDLTIALNGTCSVINTGHTYAINYYGNLNIVKASGATSAELSAGTTYYPPFGTYGLTLGSGLYLKPISNTSTTITEDPEFVLYNGYAMTNGQTITKAGGSLVYTNSGNEKTLTFTNFQDAFGDGYTQVNAIETGIAGLKVILVGDNTITCNDPDTYAFKGIRNDASIQFVKGGDGCKLTMAGNATSNSFSFGEGKVTYDKLVYSDVNARIICEPTLPTMSYNDQKNVVMQKDYTDGEIYYTITYADGKTADVAKTKYTAEFAMAAPGTVEAWVEANGATTSIIKGKSFGYQDAPFNMLVGETNTPVLIPAIETGDNIVYSSATPYSSSDDNVATFTNGTITAQGIGTATLTTSLDYDGNAQDHITLLNQGNSFTTNVTVGRVFNDVTFAEGQIFATYYNNGGGNMTVPEGLTAYMITGTNNNSVVTTALNYLPDGMPMLLEKSTNAGGTLTTTTYSGTELTDAEKDVNKLIYAEGEYIASDMIAQGNTPFVLYKNEFVKATGTIPPGRVFLMLNGVNFARGLNIGNDDDGATAIEGLTPVLSEEDNGAWYDLQGRRIEQPTKPGLYIKNGKKVIVNKK